MNHPFQRRVCLLLGFYNFAFYTPIRWFWCSRASASLWTNKTPSTYRTSPTWKNPFDILRDPNKGQSDQSGAELSNAFKRNEECTGR